MTTRAHGAWSRRHAVLLAALSVTLVAIPVEPLLGEAGRHLRAVGALHALVGVAIFALTAWLTGAATRQREVARLGRPGPTTAIPAEVSRS